MNIPDTEKFFPLDQIPQEIQNKTKIFTSTIKPGYAVLTPHLRGLLNNLGSLTPFDSATLVLLDFRTFVYPLHGRLMRWVKTLEEAGKEPGLDLYTAIYLSWIKALTDLPDEILEFAKKQQGTETPALRYVVCDDAPTPDSRHSDPEKSIYWRHRYHSGYKAGRASKPTEWDMLTKAGYEAASRLRYPIVREPFMEADDLIAQYVRTRLTYNLTGLVIWTVDTDLLQLVTDDQPCPVAWYNSGWAPYYRDETIGKAYWLKRWKSAISHPREIAAFKAEHGDASDNLPPGSDIGLIDLLDPKVLPKHEYRGAMEYPVIDVAEMKKLNTSAKVECMMHGISVA